MCFTPKTLLQQTYSLSLIQYRIASSIVIISHKETGVLNNLESYQFFMNQRLGTIDSAQLANASN